ncbi:anti-sigma factor family protein [Mesobacillus zeae]|uniref:Anti-sigma-W factor RsiW n=1 Tax=Mesobacillus zeae TaxID=1917180 RepID=A0A398AYY8_9BACI|nr:anti-sigma factor [Mesobacillus zeae]RID82772.1 anti-sigma factor [Mesobacillus zeae]
MSCPDHIVDYMHDYLDEEISEREEQELRKHLHSCSDCEQHFRELKKAIAFVQNTSHIKAPDGFTASVMAKLPKEKKKLEMSRWFKSHPFLSAASLFLMLMTGSILSTWNEDQQFSVSKQPNLVVENGTVVVPKGEVVKGDVVVRNGRLNIEGEVQGDVTVINGEKYLASAGHVTGDVQEVNEVFEWIWYHIKETARDTVGLFGGNEEDQSLQF